MSVAVQLAVLLAQPVTVTPVPASPPAPVILSTRVAQPAAAAQQAETIRVRIFGGRDVLLSDRFRVGRGSANFNQSKSESAEGGCPADGSSSERYSLNMSLHRNSYPEGTERYRISLSWTRPLGSQCDDARRTAGIEQQVTLPRLQPVILEGDGGLRVELTRE